MSDTGWVLAGSASLAAHASGTSDWTNPGNILADDGASASATAPSHYLVAHNFDFSAIPAGAVVTGIRVQLDISTNSGALNLSGTKDTGTSNALWKSTVLTGLQEFPTDGETNSKIFADYPTRAEVQTSTFGVSLHQSSGAATVDAVWMKVYYGAPQFAENGASTGEVDIGGAWTATGQAPLAAGRVIILQAIQDGATGGAVAITSATNIEDLAGTDNAWTSIGAFAVGGASEAIQHLWIGRSLSTSAPTATGTNSTSEDLFIRTYEFIGVSTGTTLATVIENATAGSTTNSTGTSATAADASVQTLGTDRLALNFVAINDDNAIALFTGQTGGTWVHVSPDYASATGTDGAIGLQYALMATAGTIDGGTGSITDIDAWGVVGFALIGTTADGPARVPFTSRYPQLLAH